MASPVNEDVFLAFKLCQCLNLYVDCMSKHLSAKPPPDCNSGVNVIISCCNRFPRLLMIEKSVEQGYPWSGDLAFPGGRLKRGESVIEGIYRETFEETCISRRDLVSIGFLPPASPLNAPYIKVAPLVSLFLGDCNSVSRKPCSREVARIALVPLPSRINYVQFLHSVRRKTFFGFKDWYGNIVWGMSLRILGSLRDILARCSSYIRCSLS